MDDKIHIPKALANFLSQNSNLLDEYNNELYRFYSIKNIKRVQEELVYSNGLPNYSNIIKTMPNYNDCFVFADYMFHMFSYGIFLYEDQSKQNDICVICGDKYNVIANSFEDFLKLYESKAIELQFG